jgi:hypothetical protein
MEDHINCVENVEMRVVGITKICLEHLHQIENPLSLKYQYRRLRKQNKEDRRDAPQQIEKKSSPFHLLLRGTHRSVALCWHFLAPLLKIELLLLIVMAPEMIW